MGESLARVRSVVDPALDAITPVSATHVSAWFTAVASDDSREERDVKLAGSETHQGGEMTREEACATQPSSRATGGRSFGEPRHPSASNHGGPSRVATPNRVGPLPSGKRAPSIGHLPLARPAAPPDAYVGRHDAMPGDARDGEKPSLRTGRSVGPFFRIFSDPEAAGVRPELLREALQANRRSGKRGRLG